MNHLKGLLHRRIQRKMKILTKRDGDITKSEKEKERKLLSHCMMVKTNEIKVFKFQEKINFCTLNGFSLYKTSMKAETQQQTYLDCDGSKTQRWLNICFTSLCKIHEQSLILALGIIHPTCKKKKVISYFLCQLESREGGRKEKNTRGCLSETVHYNLSGVFHRGYVIYGYKFITPGFPTSSETLLRWAAKSFLSTWRKRLSSDSSTDT